MTEYEYIEQRLREGMYAGNMHLTLRDVGRIAGGYVPSGRLSSADCERLGELAVSLSLNKAEAARKWAEAVEFGRRQPLASEPVPRDGGHAVGWDEPVSDDGYRIVDPNWLEREAIDEPTGSDWNPCRELADYLGLLFEADEHVCYCTESYEKDGRKVPTRGVWTKTAGEILKSLKKGTATGFSEAVGTPAPEVGAWIVVNPVDGEGRSNKNITAYRHALVESDGLPVDEQVAIYRKLELPCSVIVHSGGKSAHAIVRVDADSYEEYQRRVDFLYAVCAKNGLPVDRQNRNPSRFSRMPGVVRGERRQFIIARNCGKASFDEWEGWINELNDDLPDFEPLSDELFANPPSLAPELIGGVLRVGHKMCIAGPSKAGKSFLLIELGIAIAEGVEWIGHRCRQGRVLYLNLEVDDASFSRRIIDTYAAMGLKGDRKEFFVMWNLRGRSQPLDKLTPKIIRRAKDGGFAAIIFDPIYKINDGDENSSSDMARFFNNFDRISRECGCSVVYCHHHSKGGQGDKRSMDRASGSGVVARDADALIDLLPLESENAKAQFMQKYECDAMARKADELRGRSWREYAEKELAEVVPNKLSGALDRLFPDPEERDAIREAHNRVREEFESVSGWRVSYTLRDFATPKPLNVWFKYPLHLFDDAGLLRDCSPSGEQQPWKKRGKPKAEKVDKVAAFKTIVESNPEKKWTLNELIESYGFSQSTVMRRVRNLGWHFDKNTKFLVTAGKELKDVEY